MLRLQKNKQVADYQSHKPVYRTTPNGVDKSILSSNVRCFKKKYER